MVDEPLADVSRAGLEALARALADGSLTVPFGGLNVSRLVPGAAVAGVVGRLETWAALGIPERGMAEIVRLLVGERERRQALRDRVQLVWTGPEQHDVESRDTAVVVEDLFRSATATVLVSGFVVYQGKRVFQALAANMDQNPSLAVRLYLNIPRASGDTSLDSEIVARFAARFRDEEWPGKRLPAVFYDPRALAVSSDKRAVLHAKCVVMNQQRALVTSANLTEAAQYRNVEAGVLIDDADFAGVLESQFNGLSAGGVFRRVPNLG